MSRQLTLYILILFQASGCYCVRYAGGESSVRFLKGHHAHSICYEPPGVSDGKVVLVTAYTADPYFNRQVFENDAPEVRNITYTHQYLLGLRAETYFKLGGFPGPLLGIGPDYSFSRLNAKYTTPHDSLNLGQSLMQKQHRLNLSFNYVTWIRNRMMGYITVQPGMVWTQNKIVADPVFFDTGSKTNGFNWRVGYGFQFYIHPLININLELGYGGGAYARGGLGVWLF